MKRHRIHLIGLGIVALWASFSYAYLGVEDGSSGLGLLGWIRAVFFIPGAFLLRTLKSSYSNADLPLMAATGWLTFSLAVLAITQVLARVRNPNASSGADQ
jgi:hypothetical protein